MENTREMVTPVASQELILNRTFAATPSQVFKAWTEANSLEQWWKPSGMTLKVKTLKVQPEGLFHYSLELPNGNCMWGLFIYKKVDAPNRLVYINSFSDASAGICRAPFNPDWPLEVYNELRLEENMGQTRLMLKAYPVNAAAREHAVFEESIENLEKGFTCILDQLEKYLAKQNVQS